MYVHICIYQGADEQMDTDLWHHNHMHKCAYDMDHTHS